MIKRPSATGPLIQRIICPVPVIQIDPLVERAAVFGIDELTEAARLLEHLLVEGTELRKVNLVLHTYNFLHQKVIAIGGHKSTCQKKPEINTKIRRAIVEVYSPTDSQIRQPGHTSRAHRQSA